MRTILRNKKIILGVGIFLTIASVFWLSVPVAHADPVAAGIMSKSTLGGLFSVGKDIFNTALWIGIALFVLWLVQGILIYLTGIFADLLVGFFLWGTRPVTELFPPVIEAWGVLRDVANAALILIIIWIALTIVLNLEHLGGKKLLVRVIIVALMLNFSLSIVSVVFSFTNWLAVPFVRAVKAEPLESGKPSQLGEFIVHHIKLQNMLNVIPPEDVEKAKEEAKKELAAVSDKLNQGPSYAYIWPINQTPKAEADFGLTALGAMGLLVAGSALWAIVSALATTVTAGGLLYLLWPMFLKLAIADFFLAIVAFSIAAAALMLLYRTVALALLTVLAPAAFLMYAVPGGQKYWNLWLTNLLKWSFYAPAFFFMFWLTMIILQEMSVTIKGLEFAANIKAMAAAVIFSAFLGASISVGRYLGITAADGFINWGKKWGLGLVGMGAGGIGGWALGRTLRGLRATRDTVLRGTAGEGGKIHEGLRRAAEIPGLRAITQPIAEKRIEMMKTMQEEIGKRATELQHLPVDDRIAAFRAAPAKGQRADVEYMAAAKSLGKDITSLRDEEITGAMNLLSNVGMHKEVLSVLPNLARSQDVEGGAKDSSEIVRRYTTEELDFKGIRNVSPDAIVVTDEEKGNTDIVARKEAVRTGLWLNKNFSPSVVSRLAVEGDLNAAQTQLDHITYVENNFADITKGMGPEKRAELRINLDANKKAVGKFLGTELGRSLALDVPKELAAYGEDEKKKKYDRKGTATSRPEDFVA